MSSTPRNRIATSLVEISASSTNDRRHNLALPLGGEPIAFSRGDRVRSRTGGPEMVVLDADSAQIRCALRGRVFVLPVTVLQKTEDFRQRLRRGRKVGAVGHLASVSGAVFSEAQIVEMRDRYDEAHLRLNLAGKPELQRKVAIDIIREFSDAG